MGNDAAGDEEWLARGGGDVADVTRYYDGWAERYDDDLADWSYEAPDVATAALLEHAHEPAVVLDAGCGTGLVGRALRRARYSGVISGIDVSAESVQIAAGTGAYDTVATADLQRPLELGDDTFDGLVCVGVMTYVPDVEECWREFVRVVRPDGVVVVTQREDLWAERRCRQVIDDLTADGSWEQIEVTDARPYLPGHDNFADRIGVHYVVARVN